MVFESYGLDRPLRKLEILGKIVTGKTPPTRDKENFGTKYPFITPRDMGGSNCPKYIRVTERYLSEKGAHTVRSCRLPPESVVVSCIGSDMGKVAMTCAESFTNQQLNSVVPHGGVVPTYIYYVLSMKRAELKRLAAGGTALPILKKSLFAQIEVPLPSLPEQQKIASILGALDDKIELNHEMNKTLEEMAQAIFKSWFVDFEFPNDEGQPYRSSGGEMIYSEELGKEIPKGWKVRSVHSLADYINGMVFKMSDFSEKGLPIIKIAELNDGITDNTKFYNGEYKQKYFLNNGDILFSWSASLGIYLWSSGGAILNQHIFNVIPNEPMTKPILYFLLKEIVKEFVQIAGYRATTMGHIKKSHLQERKIAIPDEKTLKRINDLLKPIFYQILAKKMENHSLTKIRDTLLPKLLSGEIRMNAGKTEVENEKNS